MKIVIHALNYYIDDIIDRAEFQDDCQAQEEISNGNLDLAIGHLEALGCTVNVFEYEYHNNRVEQFRKRIKELKGA